MGHQTVGMLVPLVMHDFPKLVEEGATSGAHVVVLSLPFAVDDIVLDVQVGFARLAAHFLPVTRPLVFDRFPLKEVTSTV